MTHEEFNCLLEQRIVKIRNVLAKKAEEYATADRFHNFKIAGDLKRETAAQALLGMLIKHWVSIMDLVQKPRNAAMIDEKIGDAINYLCLLEGVLLEHGI